MAVGWSVVPWIFLDPLPDQREQISVRRSSADLSLASVRQATTTNTSLYRDGEPIEIVKRQLCQQSGTIDECLNRKIAPAVIDLGWSMRENDDGFIVEREIQIGGLRSSTIYRWHVSRFGDAVPVNGYAISITQR